MDSYTNETKKWLDERFRQTTNDGIYYAHQPIYGFGDKHCEPFVINRYSITYHIMKELSKISFHSLLDVGGAEGYKAALARHLFNCEVQSCDLSSEAVKRAKDIFNVDGKTIDIHNLPFDDNSFDVVLCSETLEHVKDLEKATMELIRVCKKLVVITVPYESQEIVEQNIRENIPHAHIHALDKNSFDFTKSIIKKITFKRILHPILNLPSAVVEATKKESSNSSYSSLSVSIYNKLLPLFKLFSNKYTASLLIKIDEYLSKKNVSFSGIMFVLYKQENTNKLFINTKRITPKHILNFTVPHYYTKNTTK